MTLGRIRDLQPFPLYLSHRWTGFLHHMPREQEERTKQTLVTALLYLVSTLARTWVLMELSLFLSLMAAKCSPSGLPYTGCSIQNSLQVMLLRKRKGCLFKKRGYSSFALGQRQKESLFSSREEILTTFVGLHYNCQAVLACKSSFYIGTMKQPSAATALSANGYTNFPHLILN